MEVGFHLCLCRRRFRQSVEPRETNRLAHFSCVTPDQSSLYGGTTALECCRVDDPAKQHVRGVDCGAVGGVEGGDVAERELFGDIETGGGTVPPRIRFDRKPFDFMSGMFVSSPARWPVPRRRRAQRGLTIPRMGDSAPVLTHCSVVVKSRSATRKVLHGRRRYSGCDHQTALSPSRKEFRVP